jgi:hypothetical protein
MGPPEILAEIKGFVAPLIRTQRQACIPGPSAVLTMAALREATLSAASQVLAAFMGEDSAAEASMAAGATAAEAADSHSR